MFDRESEDAVVVFVDDFVDACGDYFDGGVSAGEQEAAVASEGYRGGGGGVVDREWVVRVVYGVASGGDGGGAADVDRAGGGGGGLFRMDDWDSADEGDDAAAEGRADCVDGVVLVVCL